MCLGAAGAVQPCDMHASVPIQGHAMSRVADLKRDGGAEDTRGRVFGLAGDPGGEIQCAGVLGMGVCEIGKGLHSARTEGFIPANL